jgi:hypothetical protein
MVSDLNTRVRAAQNEVIFCCGCCFVVKALQLIVGRWCMRWGQQLVNVLLLLLPLLHYENIEECIALVDCLGSLTDPTEASKPYG